MRFNWPSKAGGNSHTQRIRKSPADIGAERQQTHSESCCGFNGNLPDLQGAIPRRPESSSCRNRYRERSQCPQMVAEGVDDYRNSINYNPRLNNNCQVYPTKFQPSLKKAGLIRQRMRPDLAHF